MTTQDKVNELARRLVDELLYGPFKDMVGCLHKKMVENLEEALNKLDGVDQPVAPDNNLKSRFKEYLQKWKEETEAESSLTNVFGNIHYLRIISLGKEAIPLILEELKLGPVPLFMALRVITEIDSIGNDSPGDFGAIARAWLRWGKENGYIQNFDPEPVRATVGCWLTRDGSKAVVKTYYHIVTERPFHGFVLGNSESFCWRENGTWNTDPKIPTDFDLLTFISPDVDYWEKEAKKPVGDGITDDTNALQAVLDKSKPFDWTQLPVSFVVMNPKQTGWFIPLGVSEKGIGVASVSRGVVVFSFHELVSNGCLWSTDRKTWREFK